VDSEGGTDALIRKAVLTASRGRAELLVLCLMVWTGHLTHVTDRWRKHRLPAIQLAYFNANGYESWENVWGVWNGITPRDAAALKRVGTLLRYFGAHNYTRHYEPTSGWVPHTPEAVGRGVHASRFERASEYGGGCVWLLVNVGDASTSGPVLRLSGPAATGEMLFVDAYHGDVLHPLRSHNAAADLRSHRAASDPRAHYAASDPRSADAISTGVDSTVELAVDLEAHGFGAVVMVDGGGSEPPPADLAQLMSVMKTLSAKPLSTYDKCVHASLPPHAQHTDSPLAHIAHAAHGSLDWHRSPSLPPCFTRTAHTHHSRPA
jgi:hypothetical protein